MMCHMASQKFYCDDRLSSLFSESVYPWDPPRSTEGAGGSAHGAPFNHLSAVLANRGGPSWVAVSECDAHLQEGQEGGSGEVQACQSDLSAGEGCGADQLECHHMARTGQPGDEAQSARVYEK